MLTVFQYPKCGTCRKALAWLERKGVAHQKVDIVLSPPSLAVLKKAAKTAGISPKKMFNVSGESYRAGNFKEKLASMDDEDALVALAKDGKLIKRPLVLGDGVALVGFKEEAWAEAIGAR